MLKAAGGKNAEDREIGRRYIAAMELAGPLFACRTRIGRPDAGSVGSRWLRDRGVMLIGGDLDESPMAYRRLPDVLAFHGESVRVLHTLRPFAMVMAGAGEFDPFRD